MRLLFVADGRSPTSQSWFSYWLEKGHSVHLASTYPCEPLAGLASFDVLPVAFGRLAGSQVGRQAKSGSAARLGTSRGWRNRLLRLRYLLGPLSLTFYRSRFRSLIGEVQPDLIHALRIPFEGMLAANGPASIPLIVSTWGNDLTLHARGSFLMARLTRSVLRRADGLIADTQRDIRLASKWGFPAGRPSLVVPGAGGIHTDRINSASLEEPLIENLPDVPIVVNPRGQRPGSLRQDVFLQAIPLVLQKCPQALFICPSLAGDAESEQLVEDLGIGKNVRLWPRLGQQAQLWGLLRRSQVFVSPSLHDGTPNSLLEAMACGCFPVVGDIESMREWIQPGVNGLLVDATSPTSLAQAIISALDRADLRASARIENAHIIARRADYGGCMALVEAFYEKVISEKTAVLG